MAARSASPVWDGGFRREETAAERGMDASVVLAFENLTSKLRLLRPHLRPQLFIPSAGRGRFRTSRNHECGRQAGG